MLYIIARKSDEIGCVALKAKPDSAVAALVTYLALRMLDKGIEILTLSNPDIYGEYKPYHYVENEKDFINCVFEMWGSTDAGF